MQTLKVIFVKQYNHTVTLYPQVKVSLCKNTAGLYNKYRFVHTNKSEALRYHTAKCSMKMYFNLTLSLR